MTQRGSGQSMALLLTAFCAISFIAGYGVGSTRVARAEPALDAEADFASWLPLFNIALNGTTAREEPESAVADAARTADVALNVIEATHADFRAGRRPNGQQFTPARKDGP